MKQSTMRALFDLENKENEKIQSFSETPAVSVKPKEVTEAEDEIKDVEDTDKEDDKQYREEHNDADTSEEADAEASSDTGDSESSDEDAESEDDDSTASISEDLNATDEDDDNDKSKLAKMFDRMSVNEILHYRMITMEYGTQAGSADPGCIGCSRGTADAADAVIIDSEIEPADSTEPDTGEGDDSGEGGDTDDMGGSDDSLGGLDEAAGAGGEGGGDTGGSEDNAGAGAADTSGGDNAGTQGTESLYAKLSCVYDDYRPKKLRRYRLGLEEYVPTLHDPSSVDYGIGGFFKDIGSVISDASSAVVKGVKATIPVIKKCANRLGILGKRAGKELATIKTLAKFYRWKLKKYLSYINEDKLKTMKIEAFPGKVWSALSRSCADISKQLDAIDGPKLDGPDFRKIQSILIVKFKKIGINIAASDSANKFAGLNKLRRGGTIYQLGYGPDAVVGYFKELEYLGEIASPERAKHFADMFSSLKNSITKLVSSDKKGSEIHAARFSFVSMCRETLVGVCGELVSDLEHVASSYEVCMDTERGDKEMDKADGAEED